MDSATELTEAALAVEGMDCASCVAHVEKALRGVRGVQTCQVNLTRGRATVRFDAGLTSADQLAAAVTRSGYPSQPESVTGDLASAEQQRLDRHKAEARGWFVRAMVGIALWAPIELTHWILQAAGNHHLLWMDWLSLGAATAAVAYVGAGFYSGLYRGLKARVANMDTLIAMGTTVAYLYSLIAFTGHLLNWWMVMPHLYFMEATGLLALISLGHWLEARARDSAGSAIHGLLQLTPATALRVEGSGETAEVAVAALVVGDLVLVRPGDRVPMDGVVERGRSSVDESMISGESVPVLRAPGDAVIGGTINQDGRLMVRATRVGAQTALAQIVQLVENAQASKPPIQRLADRIAGVFVPVVLGIAGITGVAWYGYGWWQGWPAAQTWGVIANAVCSVLIIACPCSLGLALPAALMVGTGRGASRGILIRDIDALQHAEKIDTIVLDKTGTVTLGKPTVLRVNPAPGWAEQQVLSLAASAEQYSSHPLAMAIVQHAKAVGAPLTDPDSFRNEPGLGVVAEIAGETILVGSQMFVFSNGSQSDSADHGPQAQATIVHVARQNQQGVELIGGIHLHDQIKSDSVAAIAELHRLGLRTVLLTGDNRAVAESVARQVGIDDVRAEVKPEGKAQVIRELQSRNSPLATGDWQLATRNSRIAMVGDGINDAPALATADLGIAIGSASDIAKETGDIVLVGGSLHGVVTAIRLSRATMRTIRQNLLLAFIYNILAIPLAALGLLNPLIAAAAMALSDVSVIGNALLLKRTRIE